VTGSEQRDRDAAGRARNARPRDAAGRPLPRGAAGVERVPDDLVLTREETVDEAQRLLDAGMPFHAHEVLEAAWKAAEPAERELWRGLAQLAVGLTHVQRGNGRGAVALLRRGAEHVTHWRAGSAEAAPAGLDLDGLVRHAQTVADRVEREGVAATRPADLRPRLRD
jgi:predicted metal-dependent hydrolase